MSVGRNEIPEMQKSREGVENINIFKKLREKHGYTQNIAAQKLDIPSYRIANWENNRSFPVPDMLPKVAKLYNCSIELLISSSTYPKKKIRLDNCNVFKTLRLKAGLTQTQLGKYVGVSQFAVMNWECGSAFPHPKRIVGLAKALNCTEEYLLQSIPQKSKAIYENSGNNELKKLRLQIGMSQFDLAFELDTDQSIVSVWERGKRAPGKAIQKQLAEIYGCSVEVIAAAVQSAKASRRATRSL